MAAAATPLHWLSAGELAELIRSGRVTATSVLEHFITRVEALDRGKTNLVVLECYAAARQRAAAADAALKLGVVWGPLHGVPMTVKECFAMKGVQTTCALEAYMKDPKTGQAHPFKPQDDSSVVVRVVAAGAIVFGKTNLPVGARDMQSYSPTYGTSRNPWDAERTPGGSSGGSAGALALGLTPLEIGTDVGGSIRIPAHFCGVCGHKPSQGVVDKFGAVPLYPCTGHEDRWRQARHEDLSAVGPMARSCADLQLLLSILAGPPPRLAQGGWSLALPPPQVTDVSKLRVAVWADDEQCRVDAEYVELIKQAAESLAAKGSKVDYSARPGVTIEEALEVYWPTMNAIVSGQWVAQNNWHRRNNMKLKWDEFFASGFDVLLCPVTIVPALKHDHSEPKLARTIEVNGAQRGYKELAYWASLFNISDLPSTVVPVGFVHGGSLPVGVQVVAPFLNDLTAIEVGRMLEQHHVKSRFVAPPVSEAPSSFSRL